MFISTDEFIQEYRFSNYSYRKHWKSGHDGALKLFGFLRYENTLTLKSQ